MALETGVRRACGRGFCVPVSAAAGAREASGLLLTREREREVQDLVRVEPEGVP